MHRRVRVIAPLLAGVLGVTGGAVAATVAGSLTGSSSAPSTFADPEHLGVPLQNLTCTGGYVLVVAYGDGSNALGTGIADNRQAGVKYLDTSQSCGARFGPDSDADPSYVAYLGPYPTAVAPCSIRMQPESRGDLVASLTSGNTELTRCTCVLPTKVAPALSFPASPDSDQDVDEVWARALQHMLRDYAIHQHLPLTGAHAPPTVTGTYDEVTRRYIIQHYQTPAGLLTSNGVMDQQTWKLVTQRICPIYDGS